MSNIISLAFLVLFLFIFVSNNLNWSLSSLKSEIHVLDARANDFKIQSNSLLSADLIDLKIGELD